MDNNPYHKPKNSWENKSGTDLYQRVTYCPYCGNTSRDVIKRYEGVWFRLTCRKCGLDYKVRNVMK